MKEPKTTDQNARQSTPNASKADTQALKTSQIVQQNTNKSGMLNTHQAPDNMPTKAKRGRPTKYRPKYCEQIISFFDREHTYEGEVTHTNKKGESWTAYQTKANPVPLMCSFAHWLGVDVSTLNRWCNDHPSFCKAVTHAQELQLLHLATITGMGLYNANWSVFMAKNISKWRDKKELEHSGNVDSTILYDKMTSKADEALNAKRAVMGVN